MLACSDPPVHLTYCLNIHPGETWAENFQAIATHALAVRDAVGAGGPFALGLRLSATAAEELAQESALSRFKHFLEREDLYVPTINGFPYGQFHGKAVKADVYAPDWRGAARVEYTVRLARILAALLPPGTPGSISTVPLSYKPWGRETEDLQLMVRNLADAAVELARLAERGSEIVIALEPEPDCLLETTDEVVAFFRTWTPEATDHICKQTGLPRDAGERLWRRHVGVCFDTAHAAVQFENLADSLDRLRSADVRVAKVHLSSALCAAPTAKAAERLAAFVEPTYLHQTRVLRRDGRVERFADLDDALHSADLGAAEELRTHFHVPLFFEGDGALHGTSNEMIGRFAALLRSGVCPQLEIETYTYSVLPRGLRGQAVDQAVAGEYRWVLEHVLET